MEHQKSAISILLKGRTAARLPVCALLLASTFVTVSRGQGTAPREAKPSPYAGVSRPPSDDEIVATPDAPASKAPVVVPAQHSVATPPVAYATPTSFGNEDADLVTSVDRPSAATLQRRDAESDADLVTSVPSAKGELPEGTNLKVRLLEPLSTVESQKGEAFSGLVTSDVTEGGKVVVPTGSELRGRVMFVRSGSKFGGRATLRLRPDVLILPDGSRYMLHAQVVGTQGSSTKADVEGGIVAKSHLKRDAVEYGAAAGSGAILGAQIAGGVGALVGAGIGAGIITTHLLLQEHQAKLPRNSVVVFGLTEPMTLAPIQN